MSPTYSILDHSFESEKNLACLIGQYSLNNLQADLEKTIFIPHGFDNQSVEQIIKNMIPFRKVAPQTKDQKYQAYLKKEKIEIEELKRELTKDKEF